MSERSLATIEQVAYTKPIPDADAVEAVGIRGWEVVSGKGNFSEGDKCVYFEIDSMLDVGDPRFAFLEPRGVRTDAEGRKGHVLKTIRLRGKYSQGLALPLSEFPELTGLPVGEDVTDVLGVWKWDAPVPAELSGQAIGMRPSWIWKTGAERIQNVADEVLPMEGVYATEKIDGASASFGIKDGIFHVCTHNVDLVENPSNTLWKLAAEHDIETKMADVMFRHGLETLVIQGEAYGEGLNGNRLGLKGHHFAVFNIEANGMTVSMALNPQYIDLPSVPVLDIEPPTTLEEALEQADGMKSKLSKDRLAEGIVWRRVDSLDLGPKRAVKVISNKYLSKEK